MASTGFHEAGKLVVRLENRGWDRLGLLAEVRRVTSLSNVLVKFPGDVPRHAADKPIAQLGGAPTCNRLCLLFAWTTLQGDLLILNTFVDPKVDRNELDPQCHHDRDHETVRRNDRPSVDFTPL